jgi:hypothetical protein
MGLNCTRFPISWGAGILCTGGRHRFGPVLDSLGALEAGGQTDFFAVLREFITRYSQRGLVIVISDFLDDQGCERALQFLADFGHELMLLQIWSDEDRTPPWDGELELEDAETGGRLKVQFDQSARARYTRRRSTSMPQPSRTWRCATAAVMPESRRRSRWRKWSSGR